MEIPDHVKLYEVGPRDGLQNEDVTISVSVKVEFVEKLADTGLPYVETGSFVHPDWVPQMADSDKVLSRIDRKAGVTYPVLVPNETGMENALKAGAEEVGIFGSASETFSQKNLNCSIDESFRRFDPVVSLAHERGIPVRGYVSCMAGCPYEGDIPPANVRRVASRLQEMGCYEISLGDTIGVGTPDQIRTVLNHVREEVPVEKLALHCHDTYGQAMANIHAGLQEGISVVDGSVAGLGGCPYADGATGNVATEDVLYMLNGMGIETGVDLDRLVEVAWFISETLDRRPDSRVARAFSRSG